VTHLQAVRDVLVAAPSVAALVGARVYAQVAPQGTPRPFVVLTVVSAVPYHTHDGLPAELLEAARVQVDSYGAEYVATHAVAGAVDGVLGALSGPTLSATRDSMRDDYDNETSLHRVSADYSVLR
jgi:hypothetical protein